jgi:hypothetical protein
LEARLRLGLGEESAKANLGRQQGGVNCGDMLGNQLKNYPQLHATRSAEFLTH